LALRGRIVTMAPGASPIPDGVVYIDNGTISAVQPASAPRPDGFAAITPVRTSGTIYPGLIELHNHLAYDALPLWRVPAKYQNRAKWQGTKGAAKYVSGPASVLGSRPELIEATVRYVEAKCLVGGVTTSQGITLQTRNVRHLFRGVVRNCELPDNTELPAAKTKISDVEAAKASSFFAGIKGPRTTLLHLAEGLGPDALAHFEALKIDDQRWAITEHLAGIHSTALGPAELTVMADNKGSIVWSPFSNLALYGGTTAVAVARDKGIRVSLGSDWSPSGSKNLLGELKVARLHADDSGWDLDDQHLVEMVTVNPAAILGWGALLGSLEPGKLADLMVVKGTSTDSYAHLVDATEPDVSLVVIAGVARYGAPALMARLAPPGEAVPVGGAARTFYFAQDTADPLVGAVALNDAMARLSDALANLPALAASMGAIDESGHATAPGTGLEAAVAVDGAGAGERWFLELDQQLHGRSLRPHLPLDGQPTGLGFDTVLGTAYAGFAVPLTLDPLATQGDEAFFAQLANLSNLPAAIREGLPPKYGTTPRDPTPLGADDADDADALVPPPTMTLSELLTVKGDVTLEDRRHIVQQAIVLLDQVYVHLPLKRAMHAVDPLQQLRLMQHRLTELSEDQLGPDIEFHAEVAEIFTALRDLHTHYVLPEPFQSHEAYLPFLVEECAADGRTRFVVTKLATDATFERRSFQPGVEITHWNGVPIRRAVELNAERQSGSNVAARFARGLDALTIRALGRMAPPDEEWVTITYRSGDAATAPVEEVRVSWLTSRPFEESPFADDLTASAGNLGLDAQTEAVNRVRRDRFSNYRTAATAADEVPTHLPGVLKARVRSTAQGDVGHLRIYTFLVPNAREFVSEIVRVLDALPEDGLVLDVRGNGGGNIWAAERLLQVFTPRPVEPEPAQFATSPLVLAICRANAPSVVLPGLDLAEWQDSIAQAVETGATYSNGFPITGRVDANDTGQRYHGPVVLVTDARCYSATDIFAAGFQDHAIGPVLGTAGNTGAGGANVWNHGLLRRLASELSDQPLAPLPRAASFRVAARRTTRIGRQAGTPLEDLGVVPDHQHALTLDDLVHDNVDLLDRAAELLRERPAYRLKAIVSPAPTGLRVHLTTRHLDRVDIAVDGRPFSSRDVTDGSTTFTVRAAGADGSTVELSGYAAGQLVAARRCPVTA
jgi:cytosine/adenosine deaminase-related metal-dependent hydrolase/C-terminal processing protease CtpA/Prc